MADFNKPTTTSTYANFVTELDSRLKDMVRMLSSANTTPTNVPTNAIRWNDGSNKWERYNGTAWADLAATYAVNISGNAATVTNGVYTSGSYSDPAWITTLAGSKISGAIAGNAGTATRLATARNINGVSFDGSAAISIDLNSALTFNNGGAGAASGVTFNGNAARTISYNTVGAPSTTGANASGTWAISISGNAATASSATSASSATLAAKGSTLAAGGGNGTAMTFNWSGQSGQPPWLWGGSDGSNMYVYNPSNFSVSYAANAGYASSSGSTSYVDWSNVGNRPLGFNTIGSYIIADSTEILGRGGFWDVGSTVSGSSLIRNDESQDLYASTMGGIYVWNEKWQSSARKTYLAWASCGCSGTWRLMTAVRLGTGTGWDTQGVTALFMRVA